MARFSFEVKATSGTMPSALMSWPAWMTSSWPLGERGTSTQPVNLFSRFQVDSPWRTSTRVCLFRVRDVDRSLEKGVRELWGVSGVDCGVGACVRV